MFNFLGGKNSSKSVFRPWDDVRDQQDVHLSQIKDEPLDNMDEISLTTTSSSERPLGLKEKFTEGTGLAQAFGTDKALGPGVNTLEAKELRVQQFDSLSIAYRGIHLDNRFG